MCEIEESSGNIYEDLEFPDADDMLVKAKLVTIIMGLIKSKGLTNAQAAEIIALPKSKLSRITNGHFRDVSVSTLLDAINRLGQDVKIIISQKKILPDPRPFGRWEVIS
jgi:predicted XRE-type DNA-binding protein